MNQNMEKNASESGGILCFSYSASSSSSASDNSYSFQQCSDGCVIRIPGPQVLHQSLSWRQSTDTSKQILGYILQRTDADQTGAMPRQLPKDFFIPDADYDAAIRDINDNTGERARGFEVPQDNTNDAFSPSFLADVDKILRNSNLPASAINDIQMAVEKELGKVSSNVAAMVSGGR